MTYPILPFREQPGMHASDGEHRASETGNGAERKTNRRRVLVVDDERAIADTLAVIFRAAGYEALAAYDAASAIENCLVFQPDLVLSDVIMPGMDGVELAMLITQRHPQCRIILFSGQAATSDLIERARRKGYDFEVLLKPIRPDELLEKIAA